ncbi:MAG: hypothetical protein UT99_C0011G0022 [Candidatus Curtissbacteria bacterium GW2011_GWA2_40_31]|nr:MAG: hypothetical protein UT99_C0011G0022 [Candidatus Curtissbacteria bacterium GW2011_GWA2_40_31]
MAEQKYLQLSDISCYKKALALSNYKDKIKFYYYSFGSVKESFDWDEKSNIRKLLTKKQYEHILNELQALPKEIHQLIKFTMEKLKE